MVISIASQKGGTGKTTTAISIASGLARVFDKKVLLVDIDHQANASQVMTPDYSKLSEDETIYTTIIHKNSLPVHHTRHANLQIVPSHILLSDAEQKLTTATDHRDQRLRRQLDKIKDNYDYVVIDCPPHLGWQTINALTASDTVIVPVSPGVFEIKAIIQINNTVELVRDNFNQDLRVGGYLLTMTDSTIATRDTKSVVREYYPTLLYKVEIPRNTDIRDAHMRGQDIFEFNPKAKVAEAYTKFIEREL